MFHVTMIFFFQVLPVYKHFVNCTYVFEWNTSIVCGAVMGEWTPPCAIEDSFLSHKYDLSVLHKQQQIYYVSFKYILYTQKNLKYFKNINIYSNSSKLRCLL